MDQPCEVGEIACHDRLTAVAVDDQVVDAGKLRGRDGGAGDGLTAIRDEGKQRGLDLRRAAADVDRVIAPALLRADRLALLACYAFLLLGVPCVRVQWIGAVH